MKVKSESEVAQSCPTLSDPMDWSLPGSSAHGIFQARVLESGPLPSPARPWVSIKFKSQWLPACYSKCWRYSPCLSHLIDLCLFLPFSLSLSLSTFCRSSSWSLFSPFSSHIRVTFYSFAVSLHQTLCFFSSRTIPGYPGLIGELLTFYVRNYPTFYQLSRIPTYYLNHFCVSGHGWSGCFCLDLSQGYQQRLSWEWSYLQAHLGQDLLLSSLNSCRQTSSKWASEVRKCQQDRSHSFLQPHLRSDVPSLWPALGIGSKSPSNQQSRPWRSEDRDCGKAL